MGYLDGKKVALICPRFYGYEDHIEHELRKRGAKVYLIYENLEWVKVSYRIIYSYFPKKKKDLQEKYYKKRLSNIASTLDYFIVIRGSSLSKDILNWIKGKTPKTCTYIMYQWDGVKNNNNALDIASFFTRVLTFDHDDSKKFRWIYRPLFFLPEYINLRTEKDIDVLFICALHSNRAKILNLVKKISEDRKYRTKTIVHINRILYFKYKYIDKRKEIIEAERKDLIFSPLSIQESYKLYARSKLVVDYTNVLQTGLTMRTIESLGNACKLVTNNQCIKEADFYNESNIYVYSENCFDIPNDMIIEPFILTSKEIYDRYSLQNWVDDLLGEL